MKIQPKVIQLDGVPVSYLEAGEDHARTLLLLHGGTGDARWHWEPAIPALAETFHVLAPDWPGYGSSQVPPRMRTESLLHWMKTFLDAKQISQAVVVGNSIGGLLARLFAAANPSYVPALILVNGGGVPDVPTGLKLLGRIPGLFGIFGRMATSPATLNKMIHVKDVLTESFVQDARMAVPGFARLMRMLVNNPLPKARTPMVPTLILWGANDQYATLKDAQDIQTSIPGAQLIEIAECGHMPQLEAQEVFVWQINQFLDQLTKPARQTMAGPQILGRG